MTERGARYLNVGSGPRLIEPPPVFADMAGVRFDADPLFNPDVVGDARDIASFFGDGAFRAVLLSHVMEHVYPHEVGDVLGGARAVLDADGWALVMVPDLLQVFRLVLDLERLHPDADALGLPLYHSEAGPIAAADMLYGYRPHVAYRSDTMSHKTGFSAVGLATALHRAGFQGVRWYRVTFDAEPALIALASVGSQPPAEAVSRVNAWLGVPAS